MKSIKVFIVLIAFVAMCFTAKASKDQVITYDQLPQAAKELLKKHFSNKVPLIVTMDWDDYTIIYESGEKVEFDKQGNWKEIECKRSIVPQKLIPNQIKTHVKATFPEATIIGIDRNHLGYEVKLNNGLEIEYTLNFEMVSIDD